MRCLTLLLFGFLAAPSLSLAQAGRPDTTADPYRWLEEMHGDRAMAWVKTENARTAGVLEKDPRFADPHMLARMNEGKRSLPLVKS